MSSENDDFGFGDDILRIIFWSSLLIAALLILGSVILAGPPTPEATQNISQTEKERLRNYEKYRAEIVALNPSEEQAALNWLGLLAETDYLDEETVKEVDELGVKLIVATLRWMETAMLLEKTYGHRADPIRNGGVSNGADENTDPDALPLTLLKAKYGFTSAREGTAEALQRFPISKRWAAWRANTPESVKEKLDDETLNRYIQNAGVPGKLNALAVTLDAGVIKAEDLPQLDNFGPLFLRGLVADMSTEEGRALATEVNVKAGALNNAWLRAVSKLPRSKQWVYWTETVMDFEQWRDATEDQKIMSRLIAEERAAEAEREAKKEEEVTPKK